jgi:dihydroneopterin triphosphate diphosphatase
MSILDAGNPQVKIPISVLVVIHNANGEVLLIERADRPGFWQSVTGSLDFPEEPTREAAIREVFEETGIDVAALPSDALQDMQHAIDYEIYPDWRYRYAPGVTSNREHWFSLLVPNNAAVRLAPREHTAFEWLPYTEAAKRCFSESNTAAILRLQAQNAAE